MKTLASILIKTTNFCINSMRDTTARKWMITLLNCNAAVNNAARTEWRHAHSVQSACMQLNLLAFMLPWCSFLLWATPKGPYPLRAPFSGSMRISRSFTGPTFIRCFCLNACLVVITHSHIFMRSHLFI